MLPSPRSFNNLDFFIKTLTTLNLPWNHIGDQGTQYLADALTNNTVTHNTTLHLSILTIDSVSHRHSPH